MSEKIRGKRAAADKPTQKKRKMAGAAPLKLGGISLGGDRTTRTRSAAMSEWSNDDGAPVAPPPSMKAQPCTTRAEEQSKGGEGIPEQQAMGVLEQQARGVPERRSEERSTVETARPPPKAHRSTLGPHLGALEGNASSRKCIGRPTRKYPCFKVTLVSYPYLFWQLTS